MYIHVYDKVSRGLFREAAADFQKRVVVFGSPVSPGRGGRASGLMKMLATAEAEQRQNRGRTEG